MMTVPLKQAEAGIDEMKHQIEIKGGSHITHGMEGMDWEALAQIYSRARGKLRKATDVREAFHNSYAAVFAWQNGELIGAARALSDGVYFATVVDVAVDPPFQGEGVGTAMMEALLGRLPFDKVYLTSVMGKERFYEKFGFRPETGAMGLESAAAVVESALAS